MNVFESSSMLDFRSRSLAAVPPSPPQTCSAFKWVTHRSSIILKCLCWSLVWLKKKSHELKQWIHIWQPSALLCWAVGAVLLRTGAAPAPANNRKTKTEEADNSKVCWYRWKEDKRDTGQEGGEVEETEWAGMWKWMRACVFQLVKLKICSEV